MRRCSRPTLTTSPSSIPPSRWCTYERCGRGRRPVTGGVVDGPPESRVWRGRDADPSSRDFGSAGADELPGTPFAGGSGLLALGPPLGAVLRALVGDHVAVVVGGLGRPRRSGAVVGLLGRFLGGLVPVRGAGAQAGRDGVGEVVAVGGVPVDRPGHDAADRTVGGLGGEGTAIGSFLEAVQSIDDPAGCQVATARGGRCGGQAEADL